MDNIRGKDKPGLPGLEGVLNAFPKLNFIGHGPGFWASISGDVDQKGLGGYPTGTVAPGGALDRLMAKFPNLFCDLSAGSGSNAISRDLVFGKEFLIRNQDRICFGTDYLQPGQGVPQFQVFEEQLELPAEVFAKIARGNALRLVERPA
jgi:predicted TIM-barrel fold metal-dependent hydrolase